MPWLPILRTNGPPQVSSSPSLRGRLAQCAQPGGQELTNSGFYTFENTFVQLLDSVESGKFSGRRIEFITMTQGVRHYLGKLPAGDPRKVQVNSWLDTVTRAVS